MKQRVKKILSLVLACGLALAASGCGGNDGASNDGYTVVRVWTSDGAGKAYWTEKVNEYNNTIGKEKKIKIEYTVYADQYNTILETALKSEQEAEIFAAPGTLSKYVKLNQLMPLNELPGMDDFLKRYEGFIFDNTEIIDGNVYKVPRGATTYGLIYNKDMFKKAGIVDEKGNAQPPETWDELVDAAKKLTNKKEGKYGIIFPMKWSGFWGHDLTGVMLASYPVVGRDPKTFEYDYDGLKKGFEALLQIKKDGSNFPGGEGLDNDVARAQFAEGNIGMKFAASWDVGVLTTQFPAKCDWGVAPHPLVEKGQTRYPQNSLYTSSSCVSARVSDEMKPAVAEVFKWIHSDELLVDMYEKGLVQPFDPKLTENADTSNLSEQRIAFAELLSVSKTKADLVRGTLPAEVLLNPLFTATSQYESIWHGKKDIDTALKELKKENERALKEAFKEAGLDMDDYKEKE